MPATVRDAFLIGVVALALAATPWSAPLAISANAVDAEVDAALRFLRDEVDGAGRWLDMAAGVLVFPNVQKAGFIVGVEFGDGALLVEGHTEAYYNTVAASIGLQIGVQSKAVYILFVSTDALDGFRTSAGWRVGADASVVIVNQGVAGNLDTLNTSDRIIGFVLVHGGLMLNLTLEGTKITRIDPFSQDIREPHD